MTDNTQPKALRLAEQYDYGDLVAHSNMWKAAVCTELRRQHARIAELEAEIAGGVQALSAAPAVPVDSLADAFLKWCTALGFPIDKIPNSSGKAPNGGIFSDPRTRAAWEWETSAHRIVAIQRILAASPTPQAEQPQPHYSRLHDADAVHGKQLSVYSKPPAEQQAATKAAPGEPSWWRKRADEIEVQVALTGSPEAMRCYTDMRTLLQAAAGAAPQQEAQEPALFVSAKQLADLVDPSHATGGSYLPARKTRAGLFTQPLYTAPQPAPAPPAKQIAECYGDCPTDPSTCTNPCKFEGRKAPAPLSDDVVKDAARWRLVETASSEVTLRLHNLRPDRRAQYIDAAIAAQGGK